MPNKFYSLPKSVFEHYHAKIKDWVKSILPTKTSDLTNDSDFIDQLALAGIIAVTFSASSTYKVGDYVLYNHTLYRCKTAITTAGTWDASKWDAAKTQDIFKGSAPGLVPAPTAQDVANKNMLAADGTFVPHQDLSEYIKEVNLGDIVAEVFSTSKTYAVGDYVIHEKKLHRCTTAVQTAGDWSSSNWTQVKSTDIFQGSAPGLVPAAESGDADKILKGDGTWGEVEAGSSVRVSYDSQTEELHMDFSPPPIIDPDIVLLQDWMTYDIGAQLSSGTIPTVGFDADGPLDVTGTGWSGTPYINQDSLGKVKIGNWTENTSENLKYNLENLLDLSQDWTFECWIKQSNTGYEDSYNMPSYMTLHKTSGNMSIFGSFKNVISCMGRNMEYNGIKSDTTNWHHICVIRSSGTNKLYVDGTLRTTNTSVTFSNDLLHFIIVPRLWVQYSASDYDYRYLTRIAQVCLTKRAKWTDNFTPPTKPYCLGTPRNKATT